MAPIDEIALRFDTTSLWLLNGILGLVMFGVALDLHLADFRRVFTTSRSALWGLGAQLLLLPALTYALLWLVNPLPSMALGALLVASCPGGNVSNFLTHLARGNTALSVTLSAVSTCAAAFTTPFNLAFWGSLHPATRPLLEKVALDPFDMAATVVLILALPVVLGMVVAARWPRFAGCVRRPFRIFSLLVFAAFVIGALAANRDHFVAHIGSVAALVLVHNALALGTGYGVGRLAGLGEGDRRALALEVGIQNSGLGLLLIFNFFGGLGGMAIVAAWWGVWHLISGLSLAFFWSRRPPLKTHPLKTHPLKNGDA